MDGSGETVRRAAGEGIHYGKGISRQIIPGIHALCKILRHDYRQHQSALGSLLASAVLAALYGLMRESDPLFMLWALALGLLGQLGALIPGIHDLAQVLVSAPGHTPDITALPSKSTRSARITGVRTDRPEDSDPLIAHHSGRCAHTAWAIWAACWACYLSHSSWATSSPTAQRTCSSSAPSGGAQHV